jgi:hypothetical protein
MKKLRAVVLSVSLLSVGASPLNAKGETVRIVVEGADLPKPLDITDPKILVHFNVWAGPGTGSNSPGFNPNAPSFIIDWSQGPLAGIPRGLQRYRVSFYVNYENEKLAYVVFYASDPTTKHGYLYPSWKIRPGLLAQRGHDLPWGRREVVSRSERVGKHSRAAHYEGENSAVMMLKTRRNHQCFRGVSVQCADAHWWDAVQRSPSESGRDRDAASRLVRVRITRIQNTSSFITLL